jgi:hypothetical protein
MDSLGYESQVNAHYVVLDTQSRQHPKFLDRQADFGIENRSEGSYGS